MDCVIIGGGIGGLTTAIALRDRGIDAHVFEAAPELHEVGAGISMPPNAMQVFERLGVAAAVNDAGFAIRRAEIHDVRDGLVQAMDLAALSRRYAVDTIAIHRARLQRILAARLPAGTLHMGKACDDIEQNDSRVRVRFRDDDVIEAPIVIGADGLHSRVRARLFPGSRIRYSGQTSYRGIAHCRLPSELERCAREVWSAGRRFGFSAISESAVYWFAVEDAPQAEIDEPGTLLPRLVSRFAEFPAPIATLLEHTAEHAIIRTDLCDLRPLPRWHSGRIALVGDAAHATTPNLGQGGAQAIEDACVLADCIADHPVAVSRAFDSYQRRRKPKADRVVSTSWWLGRVAHLRSPAARALRNAAMRRTPPRASERQLRFLFELSR